MDQLDLSNIPRARLDLSLLSGSEEMEVVEVILADGQRLTWDGLWGATLHTPPASTCICDDPKPERQGLVVDRGRRTTMIHCEGCSEKWDRPDGANEYAFWALGFTAGKRATQLKASETAEPEMGAWSILYGSPDDQVQEVPGESSIAALLKDPVKAIALTLLNTPAPSEPAHEPDTQDDIDYTPEMLGGHRGEINVQVMFRDDVTKARLNLVGWPEWFLPLMKLRGFTYGNHRAAIDDIATGCKAMSVTPELVVASFVAYWMPRRDQARWECPVAGLWDELGHHINEVAKATPHRLAAIREMASASVGPEHGCRYCKEGRFIWAEDLGPGGSADRWPVVCDHTSRMANMGRDRPSWAFQPVGWEQVLKAMERRLPASVYTGWVMDLELLGFQDGMALVKCYNQVHATWVYRHLIETLRDALEEPLKSEGDEHWEGIEMMMVWGGNEDAKTA